MDIKISSYSYKQAWLKLCSIAVLIGAGSTNVVASTDQPLTLGLMVEVGHDMYFDTDPRIDLVPQVFYRDGRFFLDGTKVGYDIWQDNGFWEGDEFSVAIHAMHQREGFDPDDSGALSDFQDRDTSVEGGVTISYKSFLGLTSYEANVDISKTYEGDFQRIKHEYDYEMDRLTLTPHISYIRRDATFVAYYYGVHPEEATPEFPQFGDDDDQSVELGLTGRYQFDEHWSLMGRLSWETFGLSVTESPIVVDDSTTHGMAAILYTF